MHTTRRLNGELWPIAGQARIEVDVGPAEHAVAMDVGAQQMTDACLCMTIQQAVQFDAAVLSPAVDGQPTNATTVASRSAASSVQ